MHRKLIILLLTGLLINNIMTFSQEISVTSDIEDYFMLIPFDYLKIDKTIKKDILDKKSVRENSESETFYILDTLDSINNFLKFQLVGDGEGIIFEIKLMYLKNNDCIVVIHYIGYSRCCEDSFVRFFKITGKNWTDITFEVLPNLKISDFYFDNRYAKSAKSKLYLRYYLSPNTKNIRVKLADTFFEEMDIGDYMGLKDAKRLQEIDLIWYNGKYIINK